MTTYTDSELETLMADLESDFVERKESAADGVKIRRNICAFANEADNGNPPPEFRFEPTLFTATVKAAH